MSKGHIITTNTSNFIQKKRRNIIVSYRYFTQSPELLFLTEITKSYYNK